MPIESDLQDKGISHYANSELHTFHSALQSCCDQVTTCQIVDIEFVKPVRSNLKENTSFTEPLPKKSQRFPEETGPQHQPLLPLESMIISLQTVVLNTCLFTVFQKVSQLFLHDTMCQPALNQLQPVTSNPCRKYYELCPNFLMRYAPFS